MNDQPQFVLVGHCSADSSSLSRAIGQAYPHARIASVSDQTSLAKKLDANGQSEGAARSVLLVNRVLDGDFAAEGGVELIRELAQSPAAPVMLLISNFDDAQDAAVAAGAVRGFGKSQLNQPATRQALVGALEKAKAVQGA